MLLSVRPVQLEHERQVKGSLSAKNAPAPHGSSSAVVLTYMLGDAASRRRTTSSTSSRSPMPGVPGTGSSGVQRTRYGPAEPASPRSGA